MRDSTLTAKTRRTLRNAKKTNLVAARLLHEISALLVTVRKSPRSWQRGECGDSDEFALRKHDVQRAHGEGSIRRQQHRSLKHLRNRHNRHGGRMLQGQLPEEIADALQRGNSYLERVRDSQISILSGG